MILIYVYFLVYTIGTSFKNLGLVYYSNYVLGTYNDGITQTLLSVIGGIPMGIGIFLVWPLAKKFGKRNVTLVGFILYAIGSAICWIFPTNMVIVLAGQFIKNIGGLPCAYVFMALFADTLDDVEWRSGFRCDGIAMSVYNIIAIALVGICTGIFNGLLYQSGYIAPYYDAAGSLVAVQSQSAQNMITFSFVGLEVFLMDTAAFYRKWLYDLADRQTAKGKIPCHAPDVRNNEYFAGLDFIKRMDGCCGWADVAVLLPWRLYEIYRDVTILENFYPMMKAHIKFQISRTNKTGFCAKPVFGEDKKYISNVGQAFGEWLEPPDVYKQSVLNDFLAPHSEEATAYLSFTCGIMAEIARLVGHDEDIPLYEEYNSGCKKAYNNRFVRGGEIDTDRQSKLVRPLAFNLLDGAVKTNVLNRLIESIIKREYKIGTGFLSTPLILPTLTKLGFLETAYKMMENEEAPGWLAEVKAGATTVWENWDGSASNNHYSPGSVCEWLVETVCGIKVIGENNFSIAPMPGGALTHAEFIYQSLYGTVSSKWTKKAEHIIYEITIPCGCTAFISLPSGKQQNLAAGNHTLIE